jgi:hypothetical protein
MLHSFTSFNHKAWDHVLTRTNAAGTYKVKLPVATKYNQDKAFNEGFHLLFHYTAQKSFYMDKEMFLDLFTSVCVS